MNNNYARGGGGRYPPGIGRGGGNYYANPNPNFQQQKNYQQQQYAQRNPVHHQQFQQQQQQQQWLRRNPVENDSGVVDEVEKTVQSETTDPRYSCGFVLKFS